MVQSADGNEPTQIGPGTAMGDLMRQYWLPAMKSSESEADGTPMRLMLQEEKLIAFRDTTGHAGVLGHQCPHHCAEPFLKRNE